MIKAIETRYKGYRFRSRLEARWAVFFDTLGLNWEYEPEGFSLPSGAHYLPDFRVKSVGMTHWYEVKPEGVSSEPKFAEFKEAADQSGVRTLLAGDPIAALNGTCVCPRCGGFSPDTRGERLDRDRYEVSFICHPCDLATPFGDAPAEVGVFGFFVRSYKGWIKVDEMDLEQIHARVAQAATAARSARFEHGEVPA